jgi:hypothetical protein
MRAVRIAAGVGAPGPAELTLEKIRLLLITYLMRGSRLVRRYSAIEQVSTPLPGLCGCRAR